MQSETEQSSESELSQEAFLGRFSRVPAGLDPTEVYSYFLRQAARVRQLEEQARRVSAPALLEAALREASEVRTQAAQAAERAYNEIVGAAQQEAEAQRAAVAQEAEQEAERVQAQARQELERLCVDFANFLQRFMDGPKGFVGTTADKTERQETSREPSALKQRLAASWSQDTEPVDWNGEHDDASSPPTQDEGTWKTATSQRAEQRAVTGEQERAQQARSDQAGEPRNGAFRLPDWLDGPHGVGQRTAG